MMNTVKVMEDKTLTFVTGGDNGNSGYDMLSNVFLNEESEWTEVFGDPWHITSREEKGETYETVPSFPVSFSSSCGSNLPGWISGYDVLNFIV